MYLITYKTGLHLHLFIYVSFGLNNKNINSVDEKHTALMQVSGGPSDNISYSYFVCKKPSYGIFSTFVLC